MADTTINSDGIMPGEFGDLIKENPKSNLSSIKDWDLGAVLKNPYTPAQIGLALHHTISRIKKDLEKPVYPESKLAWIKETSEKILSLLEGELKRYNKNHYYEPLKVVDVISSLQTALNKLLKAISQEPQRD